MAQKLFLFLIFILLSTGTISTLCAESLQTTWYVRPVRLYWDNHCPDGSKTADGTTIKTAFNSLGSIDWGKIHSGDEIVLTTVNPELRCTNERGFFQRGARIQSSGITIRSLNPKAPELISPVRDTPAFYSTASDAIHDIEIRDVRINQCEEDGILGCKSGDGIRLHRVTNVLLKNIDIENAYMGITVTGPHNVVIEHCRIKQVKNIGIGFLGDTDGKGGGDSIIRNNVVMHSGEGITLHENNEERTPVANTLGSGFKVLDNRVSFTEEEGLDITSGTNILVQNNITHDNGKAAVIAHSAGDVTFSGNVSYNEAGIQLISEDNPNVYIYGNSFDTRHSRRGSACFIETRNPAGSTHIYQENTCVSSSNSPDDAALILKKVDGPVHFIENKFSVSGSGYFARIFSSLPDTGIVFTNNTWTHDKGPDVDSFCEWVPNASCVKRYSLRGFLSRVRQ